MSGYHRLGEQNYIPPQHSPQARQCGPPLSQWVSLYPTGLRGYGQDQSEDDHHNNPFSNPPPMDPRYHDRSPSPVGHPAFHGGYTGSSPSPGPGMHPPPPGGVYQLQDRPPPMPLQIPVGPGPAGNPADRLAAQPTYSVENVANSYGHNDNYDTMSPPGHGHHTTYDPHHGAGDIALNPEEHHDAYYNDAYTPDHQYDDPFHAQAQHGGWGNERDDRPILQTDHTHGPDPYSDPSPPETLQGDGYMTAAGEMKPAPTPAPPRRFKTVKEVQLFEGNLILDCPVPPRLLNQIQHAQPPERDEYTHMRYSAVTGDPSEFYTNRFRLRQQLFAKPRHTELFICITMYNEEDELFARTLIGVIKNIEYMNNRTNSKTWGNPPHEAWKKIVVCVVSDGRAKINPRTRAVLAALGCYQEGIAKQQVNNKDVTAHVYEYTTQMTLDIKKGVVSVKKGEIPVQIVFCLKEKNQKKINSHRWFFQAFGSVLNPNICCLIDAGTRPGRHSIYHLWKAFELEPNCAGACGEIRAMLENGKALINPLVAAQNFEYKMSNILDKPLESVFGFISVLPGAFSAYRYVALQNDKTGQGPLEKYFKGEKLHGADAGIFTANMYLAEDRILCFELVAKRNCRWVLQYVKSSEGVTDVPTEVADFIMQRRRWLNGSFFAAVYATVHFYQIFRSSHSCIRKLMFLFEFLYQFVNQLFAWFAIGNFFLVFRILTVSLGDANLLGNVGRVLAVVFEWLYLITLVSCFILALGNRPQGSRKFYFTMPSSSSSNQSKEISPPAAAISLPLSCSRIRNLRH
ncbi:MAG: hypothetical protein Q9159_004106 [Coniocarpon cinnabarinum]